MEDNARVTPLLTVAEVAAWLEMHPTTVYRHAKQGRLPSIRVGSSYRFDAETILEWMSR